MDSSIIVKKNDIISFNIFLIIFLQLKLEISFVRFWWTPFITLIGMALKAQSQMFDQFFFKPGSIFSVIEMESVKLIRDYFSCGLNIIVINISDIQ